MKNEFNFFHSLRVRFSETDGHGHVFNANYLIYFEVAITEYFRHFNLLNPDYFPEQKPILYVKEVQAKYYQPILFDQEIEIYVRINELRQHSLQFTLEIFFPNNDTLLATGKLIWINIDPVLKVKKEFPVPFIKRIQELN